MPRRKEFRPPGPGDPWTPARAQAQLADEANALRAIADRLSDVHGWLPPPPDLADRQEGRLPYEVTTDVLATIECVLEDNLRPAIESLQRSARVTDAQLRRQWRAWLKKWRRL
jgi:hypothetical protein